MSDPDPAGGRLRGVLAMRPEVFRAIAGDPAAIRGAMLTVIFATVLAGMGGVLWTLWGGAPPERAVYEANWQRLMARSLLAGGALQVGLWWVWVTVTALYLRAFGERAAVLPLARVMGYAFAPVALQLLLAPPGIEVAAGTIAFGYALTLSVAGVREATGAAPGRVVLSVLVGFALFAITLSLLGSSDWDLAPGLFSLDPLPISTGTRSLR